ncbi:hypothetical protein F9U64_03450 [Gracilibacillus oryzae]|uniref:Endoribonuclease YicC-like N-terminal domain-containing protein n=1 Tax=Gracilibacillus oryzae TaxID=1672701 RepID=A0A7C8GVB9_9BACI|nr:YicC/YloC family endoribonuclease [Gracilibacillus oryzae]KAB8138684.1 hypothetical protein F9U64_03450 [Gracilibacillus oryzae]
MRSMTGFGKAEYKSDDLLITVQIRTVNHRFLDITTQIPSYMLYKEDAVKKSVKQYLYRGKAEITIYINSKEVEQKKLQTNWNVVEQYIANLKEIKTKYNLSGDIAMEMIAQNPLIMEIVQEVNDPSEIEGVIITLIEDALDHVINMRAQEGANLQTDLEDNLQKIENILKWLGERRNIVIIEYQ